MRCEHMVEKRNLLTGKASLRTRLRPCRHRLKGVSTKRIMGLTWRVYRCRRGHETRYYVKPSRPVDFP